MQTNSIASSPVHLDEEAVAQNERLSAPVELDEALLQRVGGGGPAGTWAAGPAGTW